MSQPAVSPVPIGTLHRLVQPLAYFAEWTTDQLKSIAPACARLQVTAPLLLQKRNGLEPFTYFLLKGEVRLTDDDGRERAIHAQDLDAGFPIAQIRPGRHDLLALPGAELLRVESSKLRSQQRMRVLPGHLRAVLDNQDFGAATPLVNRLRQQIRDGTLSLPALPDVAMRVRQLMARDDYHYGEVAAIVSADPAITARLMKVANSAIFGGMVPCQSVKTTLARLGTLRTQQILTSLVARDLFVVRQPALKSLVLQCWRHAVDIAALCTVLARLTPGLESEQAMLIGLLHEVGVLPILQLAGQFPELLADPSQLNGVLERLVPELSALILEHWQFDSAFVNAARQQNHWFYEHEGPADYTDALLLAHLHAMVHERAARQLPRIDETPAFEKLAQGRLTPELSLSILVEARSHIDEVRSLLS